MMMNIRWFVYTVAILLTVLPAVGGFFATENIVESAIAVGLNPRIALELDRSGTRLKELAKYNPQSKEVYREEFTQLQEIRKAYDVLLESSSALNRAYLEVYGIIFAFALTIALLLAWWLNRKVILSHDTAIQEMRKAQERTLYLENRESWRLFAQKLVHEVKNPLTTVQMMVARLSKKYEFYHTMGHMTGHAAGQSDPFFDILTETQSMVAEEVQKLDAWVEAFSNYARMPEPKWVRLNLNELLEEFKKQYYDFWPNLKISIDCPILSEAVLMGDPMLLKQVLFNLGKNAAEAAKDEAVHVQIKAEIHEDQTVCLRVEDDGPGIPAHIQSSLFLPYTTTKGQSQGMGLGLAIAKKVMQEHGGDISFVSLPRGSAFEMTFPSEKKAG
jgi:signal transduction histidine kinase